MVKSGEPGQRHFIRRTQHDCSVATRTWPEGLRIVFRMIYDAGVLRIRRPPCPLFPSKIGLPPNRAFGDRREQRHT
jgi:hypothetical protein